MSSEPKYRDEKWLREQYVEERQSITDIAETCGCSTTTARRWIHKHGIETRGSGGAPVPDKRLTDPQWLRNQYKEQWQSPSEIAEECDCSAQAVRSWLDKHEIERRSPAERRATDRRLTDPEWVREQYVEEKKSANDIAQECGCGDHAVYNWLDRHGIETRSDSEAAELRAGPDNKVVYKQLSDFEWLNKQYAEKKRSTLGIAEELGCSASTVRRWLRKHEIELRTYCGSAENRAPDERLTDGDWLREQYISERRSAYGIAEDCGCSDSAVYDWLDRHGIDVQPHYKTRVPDTRLEDAAWLKEQYVEKNRSTIEIGEECGCGHNVVSQWLKRHNIEISSRGAYNIADERLTDPEWLREQYVERRQSGSEIAEECDCSPSTVNEWLHKHGIKVRDGGGTKLPDQRLTDAAWLRKQYVEKKQSTSEIASECDCSSTAVSKYLSKHGIETRTGEDRIPDQRLKDAEWLRKQYIELGKQLRDIAAECGCCKTTVRNWFKAHRIERRSGRLSDPRLEDGDWLRQQFREKDRTLSEIAEKCDCSEFTVKRWLNRHGIDSQGVVVYGPGWNTKKKETVRERDDYTCQDPRCSVTQTEHIEKYGKKLHVHHLRKARDVDDPKERNAKENLITLCRGCHPRWEKMADARLVPEVDGDA